ncbi:class II fructose-bisphosphate aldolase [Candidatus Bathyarchaeota archaeon]|nr:class II fructose-bisphosphate aldolase [Candidatus Bathyarchaeota archaeon]
MTSFLTGKQLRKCFEIFCPFEKDGTLKPEEERVTILAANVNPPVDLEGRAFVMAAAQGKQSPMIIQISYNSMNLSGGKITHFKPPEGVTRQEYPFPAVDGAKLTVDVLNHLINQYGAKYVAISLDHFNVPKFDFNVLSTAPVRKSLESELAIARIKDAINYMEPVFGKIKLDDKTFNAYVNYLSSPEYQEFKRDFVNVVAAVKPAWAMIDTEKLPPVLDFVVTKEISDAIKKDLGNKDVMLEAEFGATGQSGEPIEYVKLRGKELENFAKQVVSFIKYTDADGISYPIGMVHAARKGEKHEPDVEKLEAVQRALFLEVGKYVPFAQHGGTGAARVALGLVGKDNVNTNFLVAGANAFADHYEANKEAIRAGEKKACGTTIYKLMTMAVYNATIEKLKETNCYQKGSMLKSIVA